MRSVIKHHARALMLSGLTAALLSPALHADCTYELFNISSVKGTTVGEFVDQLSEECGMSVIVADAEAEKVLAKGMNKTFLKNLTVNEVLDLIIRENGLQYTLQNNVLKISYLQTKTYNIDYIISERKGVGNTNVRLSSNTGNDVEGSNAGTSGATGGSGASSESGIKITSSDEVMFWDTLEKEIKSILTRPEDDYRNQIIAGNDRKEEKGAVIEDKNNVFINKAAGLVTVTGTGKQLNRLDSYLDDLQKKMQTQVLIDVKMYSVVFKDGSSTGIDWSQLYALQNIDLGFNMYNLKNISKMEALEDMAGRTSILDPITKVEFAYPPYGNLPSSVFQLGARGSLNEVIKFLKTQGDVYAISNPKILTLNNQPALITAGTEYFYKTENTTTLAGGTTGEQATTEVVSSVFSGVLLDITPEIAKDGSITLRINPSISETASQLSADNSTRRMPPDLSRRQMSSVISVKDGNRVILGGLINTKTINDSNKVPLLGDIPLLGYLFKHEGMSKQTEEIVIIIEPHIVKKEADKLSLGDLGYTRLSVQDEKVDNEETK